VERKYTQGRETLQEGGALKMESVLRGEFGKKASAILTETCKSAEISTVFAGNREGAKSFWA